MNKKLKFLLATSGVTAGLAIIAAQLILNYNTPYFNKTDLDFAREDVDMIETQYSYLYYNLVYNAPGRSKIYNEMDSLYQILDTTPMADHKQLLKRIQELDSIDSEIVTNALNGSEQLRDLEKMAKRKYEYIEKLKRDSAAVDSINQVPLAKRFCDNWKEIKKVHHTHEILKHQKKLKQLQK